MSCYGIVMCLKQVKLIARRVCVALQWKLLEHDIPILYSNFYVLCSQCIDFFFDIGIILIRFYSLNLCPILF